MVREDLVLSDLHDRYGATPADPAFLRLYSTTDSNLAPVFASFHQRLNYLLDFMNQKKRVNGHYNADESRQLLDLIVELEEVQATLRRVGVEFWISPVYQLALDRCKKFLTRSGGSSIPDDFGPIAVERYDQVFASVDEVVRPKPSQRQYPLQLVGEGSYAIVHKYLDEERGVYIAVKRARKGLLPKDLKRFRAEYDLLRNLSFPYIVQAYAYDDLNNSYTMEYCDATLASFISRHNARLSFGVRKRIALQFLYGVNYLHFKGILHRDISRRNILVKQYEFPAVMVKLSDFGLHKEIGSGLTATGSSMKGTIIDPTLDHFKDFDTLAEIYAIGSVLSFIFSGRERLGVCTGRIGEIVDRCTSIRRDARYSSVVDIIADVETLPMDDETTSA
ncbi:protein kinase family protein [Saccharothrix sp. 6-C]|uniref:protein kinase family protein n=1 Tax=Saccharothrix sp. 6-C TaxID=2781735 RepID=UPI0019177970|nr:protein kinase family protein [Saccharothrix sp. 6-C]QQQ80153.1 protein kinase family protein [Saccharothrix sp. 6-C]